MSEAPQNLESASEAEFTQEESRYLLFRLGGELYGTPLLGVREVVEMQEAKAVPNTTSSFLGVINIRGQIVGVIDLRARFGLKPNTEQDNAMMVFDTENGTVAALVDQVEAVVRIPDNKIEANPKVKTAVPTEYMLGIAQDGERLVTLFDLNRCLEHVELRSR